MSADNPTTPREQLDHYRATQTGSGWHTAPDDGLLYDQLTVWLKDAGRLDELAGLFATDDWLHARVAQSDYQHYLADLDVAWNVSVAEARTQIERGVTPDALAACFRYGFIESALSTWAESHSPPTIARAVEVGMWTPERAMSFAALIPDAKRQADVYLALGRVRSLTPDQAKLARDAARALVESIDYDWDRERVLEQLAQQLEGDQQRAALNDALEVALRDANGSFMENAPTLYQLIDKLPDDLLKQALEGTRKVTQPEARVWALAEIARRLSEDERRPVLADALDAAAQIPRDINRANALARITPYLREDQAERGLALGLELREGNWRPRAVTGVASRLDEAQLRRMLEAMLPIEDEWWRADGLLDVADYASGDTRRRALDVLLRTRHGETRTKILRRLSGMMSAELAEQITDAVQAIDDPDQHTWALEAASRLTTEREWSLPTSAASIRLSDLHAGDAELDQVLAEKWEEERSLAFRSLAPRLTKEVLPRALDAALAMEEQLHFDWSFEGLAPRLDGALLARALRGKFNHEETGAVISIIERLVGLMSEPVKSAALRFLYERALAGSNPYWRLEALIRTIPRLDADLRRQAIEHLYALALDLDHEQLRPKGLIYAAKWLEGQEREQAVAAASEAVWAFLLRTPEQNDEGRSGFSYGYAVQRRLDSAALLLPLVSEEEKHRLLTAMLDLADLPEAGYWIGAAMQAVIPALEGDFLTRGFDRVLKLNDADQRSSLLIQLADRLTPEQLERAALSAEAIERPGPRIRCLLALSRRMDAARRQALLERLFAEAAAINRNGSCAALFVDLAQAGYTPALAAAREAIEQLEDATARRLLRESLMQLEGDSATIARNSALDLLAAMDQERHAAISTLTSTFIGATPGLNEEPRLSQEAVTRMVAFLLDVLQTWQWYREA